MKKWSTAVLSYAAKHRPWMRLLLDARAILFFTVWGYFAWIGVILLPAVVQYLTTKYGVSPPLYVSFIPYLLTVLLFEFIVVGVYKLWRYLDTAADDRVYGDTFLLYPIVGGLIWLTAVYVPVDWSSFIHVERAQLLPESAWLRYPILVLMGLVALVVISIIFLVLTKKITVKGLRRMLEK